MQPGEFRALPIPDWWAELDAQIRQAKHLKKGLGGASQADWEDAIRRHKERNGK